MDNIKIGNLIAQLRQERGLTQQDIANALSISNKTISKWECGLGAPNISLWADLSTILGADVVDLMEGEMTLNEPDGANINKIRFYVCPTCHNVLVSTGSASIFCCGRKLTQLEVVEDEHAPNIKTEVVDIDYFITIDHEMTRNHHILFAAYVKGDKYFLNRLYPEQDPTVRMPYMANGQLYLYCIQHGLTKYSI